MTLFLAAVFLTPLSMTAQQSAPEYDRERYINEIRNYKHDFLARDLDIPRDRQRSFFEHYDAMEDEIMQLNAETRELEGQVESNADATDVEIDAAISSIFNQKQKEAEIENRYLELFREDLTPRQILRLKSAERRFNQQLMRRHRRHRSLDDGARGPRR